jgi:hypothetical protein
LKVQGTNEQNIDELTIPALEKVIITTPHGKLRITVTTDMTELNFSASHGNVRAQIANFSDPPGKGNYAHLAAFFGKDIP